MSEATPTAPLGRFRYTRAFLAVSMLVMGTCGIVYEYALGLQGNNLLGSSHEQIFVIIGIMMFAMGMGALGQRRLERDLVDWFLRFELLLGLLGGFGALLAYVAFVHLVAHELVLYGLAFCIGALIGLEIPLLIRINSTHADSLRTNLGDILSMDYVGSLVGALLFTYVLLSWVSLASIAMIMGCANVALAGFGLAFFWPLVRRPGLLVVGIGGGALLLTAGLLFGDGWVAALEQRCYEDPILHSETTRYQHLVLTQRAERSRLYINGHLQFDSRDEAIYHEQLVHVPMTLAPRHGRVLILGGGDGLALRELVGYRDVREVTLVDLDARMIALASEHPELVRLNHDAFADARVSTTVASPARSPGPTERIARPSHLRRELLDDDIYDLAEVEVFTVDADNFVRAAGGLYDVVLIDLPDPRTLELAKLYSVDFYRALRERLAPGALVALQATSPYRARDVFLCIAESLRVAGYTVLPYRDYLPSFGDWGWQLAWTDGSSEEAMRARIAAVTELAVPTRYLTPDLLRASFVFGRDALVPPPDLRPNTKMRPVITAYYNRGFR